MRNVIFIRLCMPTLFLLAAITAFGGGYFHDQICDVQDAATETCNRLSDGQNSVLGWLSGASYVVAGGASLGSIALIITSIFCLFESESYCWANRDRLSNKHLANFKCIRGQYCSHSDD